MDKRLGKLYLPDPIAEAVLAGNLDYPQTGTGIALYGSRAALDMIVEGQATWPQIMNAQPTAKQMHTVKKAVSRAHKAFDIKYRHEDDPEAGKYTYDTNRLASLTMSFLAPFARAVTGFTAGMIPGVEPVPDEIPIYMRQQNTPNVDAMKQLQITALDVLFGREATTVVRPEVIALQGIWAAAQDALNPKKNPTAREIVKKRLPHIRLHHIAGKHSADHKNAGQALREQDRALTKLVTDAVYLALPGVQDTTNLWVPSSVVEDFLHCYFGTAASTSNRALA